MIMFLAIAQWGSFTLHSYGFFVAAAFGVGILWAMRRARQAGLPASPPLSLGQVISVTFFLSSTAMLLMLKPKTHGGVL